jgi:hypothetical protein
LRLIVLTDVPPGLRYDELLNYRMASRVLAGERPLYFTESWGEEPLFLYTQAAVVSAVGASEWSLRLPSVLFGWLAVLATWLAARRLFGARVALLAASALAVSFWSIFYSRQGLRVLAVTPFHSLMVYFTWRGLSRPEGERRRAAVDFVLAGVLLGIPFYIYPAARLMPLLPLALIVYGVLSRHVLLRRAWTGLVAVVIVAAVVASPLVATVYGGPAVEQRIDQLAGEWRALMDGRPGPVLQLVLSGLGMFVWRGEEDWLYNVFGRPIFDPLSACAFALGIAICAWRWREARRMLLLTWLVAGIAPAVVVPPPASLSHSIAAQPPAYVVLALGLDFIWRACQKWRRWAGPVLGVGTVALHGVLSGCAYFVTWANAPSVRELHQGAITSLARELEVRDPRGPVLVGAPFVSYWHPWNVVAFDLALRREDLNVRWFSPEGGWIWPAGAAPATFYFPTDPLGPQTFDPALHELFIADAEPLSVSGDDFVAFRLARPAALEDRLAQLTGTQSLSWPPGLTGAPPPIVPLPFDGRLALLGAELHGGSVVPGEELELVTFWQVQTVDASPVVAFAHLTSDGEDIWGQHDWLDVWPVGLLPGDRFAQVHSLQIKPECPPGTYHVQVGLYRPDTLQRLLTPTADGRQADRVWVGGVTVTAAE